jgi:oxygen-independent coproporphyrinogen III oxidase
MKEQKRDLGLYIHIPFCVKKCDYCDFLSAPADEETKKLYVKALLSEIDSLRDVASEYLVKTIFIGGGTPSSIDGTYIIEIMEAVRGVFESANLDLEITIEVNPGTLSKEKLLDYKQAGINRLSFGLQSTDNLELKKLGRIHTFETFVENYHLAREVGFQNINIDLMSALPGQTLDNWLNTLDKVVHLNPEHISAYSLIIEEGTPFYNRYNEEDQDDELDRLIYSKTKETLEMAGYFRYEISNYAKLGYECKHNSSYWTRTEYLGLGLGASSLIQNTRFHNEENLQEYIKLSNNYMNIRREMDKLTLNQQMEEFMFLGLRMQSGINTIKFHKEFGIRIEAVYGDVIKQSIDEELLALKDYNLYLTDKGLDISNLVMSRFLID